MKFRRFCGIISIYIILESQNMLETITVESLNVTHSIKKQINQLALKDNNKNNNKDFFSYSFPDTGIDLSAISLEAKPFGIYLQRFINDARFIQISWHRTNPKYNYSSSESSSVFTKIFKLVPSAMSWDKLTTETKAKAKPSAKRKFERTTFEHDYDRIIFSHPFKLLQYKTQVIPLSGNDFIHNRLTHSVEVAAVGRDLARRVIDGIWDEYMSLAEKDILITRYSSTNNSEAAKERFINDVANIVSCACLIHDLGNPPFGHQGERALSETYQELKNSPQYSKTFSNLYALAPDIFEIEGNAQTLRLINTHNSIDLSYATLASVIKYPTPFYPELENQKPTDKSIYKKFNIYNSEIELLQKITAGTGLINVNSEKHIYARHPLAYLVEAADDICYGLFDFEDFVRLGFISQEEYCHILIKIIIPNSDQNIGKKLAQSSDKSLELLRLEKYTDLAQYNNFNDKVNKLRSEAMNQMISNACYAFKQYYYHIISGCYSSNSPMLDNGRVNSLLGIYGQIISTKHHDDDFHETYKLLQESSRENGYNHEGVLKNGLGGYEIISHLLKCFIEALHNLKTYKSKMTLGLLPEEYLRVDSKKHVSIKDLDDNVQIEQIQLINDYLTGMSDNYACNLYKKLRGVEQVTF